MLSQILNSSATKWLVQLPLFRFPQVMPNVLIAALALTPMEQLYSDVWMSSFWTWFIVCFIVSCIAAFIIGGATESLGAGLVAFFVGAVMIGGIGGYINANSQANAAVTTDWQAAIDYTGKHVEKLLGVWVKADEQMFTCHYADTSIDMGAIAATGCRYVTKDSYCVHEDKDGNCDDYNYKWYPWFIKETSTSADLNVYENGHVVFSDHCAPDDWQSNLVTNTSLLVFKSQNLPSGSKPGTDFCYGIPKEWSRIDTAVKAHQLLPGVVYHVYFNWIAADPETIFRGSTTLVPNYSKLGLMPTIEPITDSSGNPYAMDINGKYSGTLGYDYQIVQYLGSLKPSADFQKSMQNTALLWGSGAGPTLKMNLMLNFAYAREVPNKLEWISLTKAHLMDKSVYGRQVMPYNITLLNCGLDDTGKTVQWCVMETGAFEGNVELEQDVSQLRPFAFTPEAIFGILTGGLVVDTSGKTVVQVAFNGGVINDLIYGRSTGHGFVHVSTATYAEKRNIVQPDAEQIKAIASAKNLSTWLNVLGLLGIIIVGGGFIVSKSASSS